MRHLTRAALLAILLVFLAASCSRKKAEPTDGGKPDPVAADEPAAARARLTSALKGSNEKARADAVEEASTWIESDPETVAVLIELVKDKSNAGLGRTHPMRIASVREAAVRALALGGPKGEAALKERGFPVLRDGLADPQPAVCEHTAYAIGLIGPRAKPLSADVMKLCTHADEQVRGAAFDALRSIGIADVPGFVRLLTHSNSDIGKLAAELVPTISEFPETAVAPLVAALDNANEPIRLAAASGLGVLGPRAADAVGPLVERIKKTYPDEFDPEKPISIGPEIEYWRSLVQIGPPAIGRLAELLARKHPLARALAARALGDFGPLASGEAEKLKDALKDPYGVVAVEAACALSRIGVAADEATEVMKRAIDAPNNVAQIAIEAIPRMGLAGRALIPVALLKLSSENPFARYAAVGLTSSMAREDVTKHADRIGKLVLDDESEIRRRAVFALARIGPAAAPAADSLGKALASERDEAIRDSVLDLLISLGPAARSAVPVMLPLAQEPTLSLSRRARLLSAIAGADSANPEINALLVTVSQDPDQFLRAAAARALGKINPLPANALARLVALAKSDSRTEPRLAALRALAEAGTRAKSAVGAIDPIAIGTQEDSVTLLARIAVAAMSGDGAKAGAIARAGLADKRPDIRAAASRSLAEFGPKAEDLPKLQKLLTDGSSETRECAAICLGRLGPAAKDAVNPLIRMLGDGSGEVRIAAAEALGEIGAAASPAIPRLQKVREDDPVAGPPARRALEKLGVSEERFGR